MEHYNTFHLLNWIAVNYTYTLLIEIWIVTLLKLIDCIFYVDDIINWINVCSNAAP